MVTSNLKRIYPDLWIPEDFESNHHYFADASGEKEYTGVTTVLGILNKPQLIPWAARMAVESLKENPIEKWTDENGTFYTLSDDQLTNALTAYAKKRDDAASKGTDTHTLVESYVKHCIEQTNGWPAPAREQTPIDGFRRWAINGSVRFLASEQQVYSKSLFVAGTFDLLFEKDGKRYIGDIKTYKKIWDRTPFFQCAGYALMWEEMNPLENIETNLAGLTFGVPSKIDGYCIINLPKEREFDEVEDVLWSWDTEGDTKAFLACVEIYRQSANFTNLTKSKK